MRNLKILCTRNLKISLVRVCGGLVLLVKVSLVNIQRSNKYCTHASTCKHINLLIKMCGAASHVLQDGASVESGGARARGARPVRGAASSRRAERLDARSRAPRPAASAAASTRDGRGRQPAAGTRIG